MRDLFKEPLTADELRSLTAHAPATMIFSWKSPTARQRGLAPGSLTDEELIALMASEPRLIRRPLTLTGERLIIGADVKQLEELVPGTHRGRQRSHP